MGEKRKAVHKKGKKKKKKSKKKRERGKSVAKQLNVQVAKQTTYFEATAGGRVVDVLAFALFCDVG